MEKNNKNINIPTFLKWAGGKRRILSLLETYFPKKVNCYFEPFLGGGSVFFYFKKKYNPKLCIISDSNEDLVNSYLDVRDNPRSLIKKLYKFKKNNSEHFFYSVREKFNKKKYKGIERSAAFIYLNKTCFNGLYRVNKNNEFNVPFGKFTNPGIFEEEIIYEASALLKDNVIIKNQDYKEIEKIAKKGDFVYLDPCYDPLKKTSFVQYTPDVFCEQDRIDLYGFIEKLKRKKVNVLLSNNDIPEIRKLYHEYDISEIMVARVINSKSDERQKIKELVIKN